MAEIADIKVSKEIADLAYVYCKLNDIKMLDFVNGVFEEKFKGFKERVRALDDFKVK